MKINFAKKFLISIFLSLMGFTAFVSPSLAKPSNPNYPHPTLSQGERGQTGKIFIPNNGQTFKIAALPDAQCIKNEMKKRDNAIIAALDKRYISSKTALETRMKDLSAARDIVDQKSRRAAIKTAWQKFQKSAESAQKNFKAAKSAAWKQFYADRKACGKAPASDDRTTEGVDVII